MADAMAISDRAWQEDRTMIWEEVVDYALAAPDT
jgi:hypothetical protein